MKFQLINVSIEALVVSAGVVLLGMSGWDLVKFTAFQKHPEWFGASNETVLRRQDVRRASSRGGPNGAVPRVIGRLEIPRLHASVLVLDKDDDESLSLAAGHVPGTAWLGSEGNSVIAGHRDTAFRALRNIRVGDRVRIESGRTYDYIVDSVRIVAPDDLRVLRDHGGAMLTLITCYPFGYIGDAPKRYVVRAKLKEVAVIADGDQYKMEEKYAPAGSL